MKLEIKHVVPYLPYGLKFLYNGNIYKMRWINRFGDIDYDSQNDFINPFPPNIFNKELDLVKLIFRPLSDLTKEIEVNGQIFKDFSKLLESITKNKWVYFEDEEELHELTYEIDHSGNKYSSIIRLPYYIFQKLLELHFDVFGLIPAGLAIDINEIFKNNLNKWN